VTAAQDMRGLRDHWVTTGRREPIVLDRGAEALLLAIATVALVALGTVMVFNTSFFHANERFGDPYLFIRRHLVAVAIGTLGLVVARRVPTRVIRRFTYPLLALLVVALVAVLVPGIGLTRGGATRWLPVGPLTVQPSELVKLAVVLYLAHSLAKKGERIRVFATGYLPHLVIVGGIALLVVLEPDYGTAVLLSAVLFLMLVAAGARASHLAGTVALALPLLVVGAMSAEYRMRRILSFLDPWQDAQASGFQLVQSLIAFGSGGLFGVGLGAGQQKMFYLPGAHTDFVFSVIGEELGLVGALSVLVAFAVLAVGSSPTATPMLTTAWSTIVVVKPSARCEAKGSGWRQAMRMPPTARTANATSTESAPTRPSSSPITEKTKSVCAPGR
jgi:cell division protein FtsW